VIVLPKNLLYAQSGGVTPVINASAYGAIRAALTLPQIKEVYAAKNGIQGVLDEELYHLNAENPNEIEKIPYTPGGIFGSCRVKISSREGDPDWEKLERIFEVFRAHDIGYFLYNGGNDSMETAHAISAYAKENGLDLRVIGIPKTVDNDLLYTDYCPGYGSAAKFTATAILEATKDLKSMSASSTKVFILESMGRHAGWLAASSALSRVNGEAGPSVILLPEIPFSEEAFLTRVEEEIRTKGFCSVVASEALKDDNGDFISTAGYTDSFGNVQLGKICFTLEKIVREKLNVKVHTGLPDYLQRSSRHIASLADWQDAIEAGARSVFWMVHDRLSDMMTVIIRDMSTPYIRHFDFVPLSKIAGKTRTLPAEYIDAEALNVTEGFMEYALPLIKGEAPDNYHLGIPVYANLKYVMEKKRIH